MTSALPEIREDAATGEIADLYADMRAVMAVPMVNLVYRHIATVPNGLAWVWTIVRPHVASGAVDALAAAVLARAASNDWGEPSPLAAFAAEDRAAVTNVVNWYNRANAVNLVTLLALRAAEALPARGARTIGEASARKAPDEALPPPLSLGAVEPLLRERILALAGRQGLSARGVTPTMYLHLARRPAAFSAILDAVERAMDRGVFERNAGAIVTEALSAIRGARLPLASSARAPDHDGRATIDAALETFAMRAIPQMLAVGVHLVRAGRP